MKGLYVSVAFLSIMSLACGFLGSALSMHDTTMPAGGDSYDRLANAATARGWRAQPAQTNADGEVDNWKLQVFPSAGEKIILTDNNSTGQIAFTCEGEELDDDDKCIAAVEGLCHDAFETECNFHD